MPMNMQIAPICEADIEEVSRFLRAAFGCDEQWTPFRPDVLSWKALTPHPVWEGSRGYAMRRQGEIVAYGCAVPTRFVWDGGSLLVACVIDWAANKAMPGGGVAIYNHIAKFTGGLIGVGGSDDAHRVVKRMGFQARQEFDICARVTKPVRRFRETRTGSWRDMARLGRNVLRGLQPVRGNASGWTARRVERFDGALTAVLPRPHLVGKLVCYRNEALLNYMLLCPAARVEGYVLERGETVVGYFLLAFARGECRIAELWVASADERDWLAGLLLAAEGREGSLVSIGCGSVMSKRVAGLAKFHTIARLPVYVKDPKGTLPIELDATMSMLDTDAFYL
jgi:hypothetical protein